MVLIHQALFLILGRRRHGYSRHLCDVSIAYRRKCRRGVRSVDGGAQWQRSGRKIGESIHLSRREYCGCREKDAAFVVVSSAWEDHCESIRCVFCDRVAAIYVLLS